MKEVTRRSFVVGHLLAPLARIPASYDGRSLTVLEPAFARRAQSLRVEVWLAPSGDRGHWERLRFCALARERRGWRVEGLPPERLHVRVLGRVAGRWLCAAADVGSGSSEERVLPRIGPGLTCVEHAVWTTDGRRVSTRRALPGAGAVGCELVPDDGAPTLELVLAPDETLRVRGLSATRVRRRSVPGPEACRVVRASDATRHPRWAVRPGSRSAERLEGAEPRFRFVDEVARVREARVRLVGVPKDAQLVTLHARGDAGWRTAPVEVAAAGFGGSVTVTVVEGGELLARAFDAVPPETAEGGSPGRIVGVGWARLEAGSARTTLTLERPAAAVLSVPGARPGDAVRVRLEGWALELHAGPLGRDRRAHIRGLVPDRRHVVLCGDRQDTFRAPRPERSARWALR